MIVDARKANLAANVEFDLIIVGSGAAGITLALSLRQSGLKIAMIEAGGERFSAEAQQLLASDAISPKTHSPTHMYRQRLLGGSTAIWGGRCIPFDPIDFEDRPWMEAAHWPITHGDVAKHWPQALRIAEAGLPEFNAAQAWPGDQEPMVKGVDSADVILDRIERFSKPSHFGKIWRENMEQAANLTVYTHAPVTQILLHDNNRVRGVRCSIDGRAVEITAPRVVLAAGGIETARLLLASRESQSVGVGNGRDLVGRYYQCHLEGEVGHLHFLSPSSDLRLNYGKSHDDIYCRRYIWLSPEAQRREHLGGMVLRPGHPSIVDPRHRHPVLSAMYLVKNFIVPEYARKMTALEHKIRANHSSGLSYYGAHLANILRGAPKLAIFGTDWLRRRTLAKRKLPSVVLPDPRNFYPADINAEQEPNYLSRISIGDTRDALDMPRVQVDWRTTDADYERLVRSIHTISAAFATSRTVRYDVEGIDVATLRDLIVPIGGHHIGTARMADSAAEGVCDSNCEVFDAPGLFIAGAASFPTSSFANPTLTIVALSLRLAEYLAPGRTLSI